MTTNPSVLPGKDGWLFLDNDSNRVLAQVTGTMKMPIDFKARWERLFDYRAQRFAELRIPYSYAVVPNKECVYQEFLPDNIKVVDDRPVAEVIAAAEGRIGFHYLLDDLRAASKDADTYIKGDTHWNHRGAFVAFNALMRGNDLAEMDEDAIRFEERQIPGDLTSKIGQTTTTTFAVIKKPGFKKPEFNGVANQGQRLVYENENKTLPSLVLFRDSFASHQLEMFASMFSRVVALWQPNVDYSVVEQERPDFVIGQQAERFLVVCPDDLTMPSAAEYEARKKVLTP